MIREKLKSSYINKDGKEFSNVLNYHFDKGEWLTLGRFITSSHDDDVDEYGEGDGIYLFQDTDNPNIAYRIDREYNNEYACDNQKDVPFIQKLREKQQKISLTQFIYGVVTIGNRVVGQIIPFYEGAETLRHFVKEQGWEHEALYMECLSILKELCANGVYYYDMNADNFVITNEGIRIIDFDRYLIDFDESFSDKQKKVLDNFKTMLNILSKGEFKEKYPEITMADSFEKIEDILENNKKNHL